MPQRSRSRSRSGRRSRSQSPRRRRSRSRERREHAHDSKRTSRRDDRGFEHRERGEDRRDDRNMERKSGRDRRGEARRREGGDRRAGRSYEWGRDDQREQKQKEPPKPKEKANLGLSGKLAEDTNMYKGVLIKYSEPPNARMPKKRWRLYPFKGEEAMKPLYVHRQSGYLIGRDRKIADIPLDHPSISKQHAVLQYRQIEVPQADGSKSRVIKPYVIDLESANGTYLNGSRIDSKRYVELKEKDVLKFGFSTREYVVLSENAHKDDAVETVAPSDSESEPDA